MIIKNNKLKENIRKFCDKDSLNKGRRGTKVDISKEDKRIEKWYKILLYSSYLLVFPILILGPIFSILHTTCGFMGEKCLSFCWWWKSLIMRISGLRKRIFLINLDTYERSLLSNDKEEIGEELLTKHLEAVKELRHELSRKV